MDQITIASLALLGCALFVGGYTLGWRHRGEAVATAEPAEECLPDLEAQVRRSQR